MHLFVFVPHFSLGREPKVAKYIMLCTVTCTLGGKESRCLEKANNPGSLQYEALIFQLGSFPFLFNRANKKMQDIINPSLTVSKYSPIQFLSAISNLKKVF